MFAPLHTARLIIRAFGLEDAAPLAERRNDSLVARYQNWVLPYPRQRAEDLVAQIVAAGEPANDQWWMAAVCDRESGETLGDLALRLSWGGRSAEVGYTLASRRWGRGYATEALEALLAWLFAERGITRACGTLHPDNTASARVLERCGFLFEGRTRLSYWVGDDCSDDATYGLTRQDWEAWSRRPRQAPSVVALVEVSAANQAPVLGLLTHKTQEAFVPPAALCCADALFPPEVDGRPSIPWLRAITADGEIAGLVMLARGAERHPEPILWRLLVDRLHQRRGIGTRVLHLVAADCRERGETSLLTRWADGPGSPRGFFTGRGFSVIGATPDGLASARLRLR